jgi:hypothetical protein
MPRTLPGGTLREESHIGAKARLFYYSNKQAVLFENAIDQCMTFIVGTGHQMELEAIRSTRLGWRYRPPSPPRIRANVEMGRRPGTLCLAHVVGFVAAPSVWTEQRSLEA